MAKRKKYDIFILTTKIQNGFEKGDFVCITGEIDEIGFFPVKLCNKKGYVMLQQVAYALEDDLEEYKENKEK